MPGSLSGAIDLTPEQFAITHDPTNVLSTDPSRILGRPLDAATQMLLQLPKFAIKAISDLLSDPTLLSQLVEQFPDAGLEVLNTWAAGIPILGDVVQAITGLVGGLPELDAFFGNWESAWGGLDFTDPLFDPAAAAELFIQTMLLPTNLIPGLSGGLLAGGVIPGLDASKIVSGTFPQTMVTGLVAALAAGGTAVLDAIVNTWLGGSGSGYSTDDLNTALTSVPTRFLSGALLPGQLTTVSVGNVSSLLSEMVTNGNFDTAAALFEQAVWTWTGSDGPSGVATSVFATATGALKELFSNAIFVYPGQQLDISGWTKWSGFTGAANSIALTVAQYSGGAPAATPVQTIASIASPGASGAWEQLSSTYTVPAGVDTIYLRPVITAAATAGTVSFGKLSAKPVATSLLAALVPSLDASKIVTGTFPWIMTGAQDAIDAVADTLAGGGGGTGYSLANLKTLLSAIPSLLVQGVAGPSDIGGSVEGLINNWVGGLVGDVGLSGSLGDVFNTAYEVSSRAFQGMLSWERLGVRSDKPGWMGMLPTGVSNIPIPGLTSSTAPTFAVTPTAATMGYHHIDQDSSKGVVSWEGSYTAGNITSFFINIYRVNPTTGLRTLVHSSANIAGDVPSALGTNLYTIPTPLAVLTGEWYGIEFVIRGTGPYNIVGAASWRNFNHPTVLPKRLASVRDSSTTASPATITEAATTYAANIPFTEFAVSGGISDVHAPELRPFQTPGQTTTVAPTWANYAEVITCGRGGNGAAGSSTVGIVGIGGTQGLWNAALWVKGTHFNAGDTFTIRVPSQDDVPSPNGGIVTASIAVGANTITSASGTDGPGWGSPNYGEGAGDEIYGTPSVTYVGGARQNNSSGDGQAPGGGGAGGAWGWFGIPPGGGWGARGACFVRFRQ